MTASAAKRISSIDALRGLVMLLMLVDHVRETVFLHMQVGNPVDVTAVTPGLFFTRDPLVRALQAAPPGSRLASLLLTACRRFPSTAGGG